MRYFLFFVHASRARKVRALLAIFFFFLNLFFDTPPTMPVASICPAARAAPPTSSSIVPIVYVFTVNPFFSCKTFNTKDHYIRWSVEQAVRTARGPKHPVILAANFRDCNHSLTTVKNHWHRDIVALDYSAFLSPRTVEFTSLTDTLFMQSFMPELWAAAALRFFVLEDLMVHHAYQQVRRL